MKSKTENLFYVKQNNGNLCAGFCVQSERDLNPVCQRTSLLYSSMVRQS